MISQERVLIRAIPSSSGFFGQKVSSEPSAHPSSGWDNGATSLEFEPI